MPGQWPDDESGPATPAGLPQKRQPRGGLRTLGFLGLALLAMVTAISLGGYTFGTFGSLLFGLIGAGYCSIKGLRVALDHEALHMVLDRYRRR
jgi:hypothetical protein